MVTGPDPRSGRDRVNVIGTITGGGGARGKCDGVDGTAVRYSQVAVPIEIVEVETALVIRNDSNVVDTRSPASTSAAPRRASKSSALPTRRS